GRLLGVGRFELLERLRVVLAVVESDALLEVRARSFLVGARGERREHRREDHCCRQQDARHTHGRSRLMSRGFVGVAAALGFVGVGVADAGVGFACVTTGCGALDAATALVIVVASMGVSEGAAVETDADGVTCACVTAGGGGGFLSSAPMITNVAPMPVANASAATTYTMIVRP